MASQILPARRAGRCDFLLNYFERRWLGSRVVSVLDSGAEGPGFKFAAATLSGNSLRQTVHTHCASVHQAAKLVAAPLRVVRVTAGLAESNGSLPPGIHDSRHLQADCQEPGSAPEPYARQSTMGYLYLFYFEHLFLEEATLKQIPV